jgi:hypothetical protein
VPHPESRADTRRSTPLTCRPRTTGTRSWYLLYGISSQLDTPFGDALVTHDRATFECMTATVGREAYPGLIDG